MPEHPDARSRRVRARDPWRRLVVAILTAGFAAGGPAAFAIGPGGPAWKARELVDTGLTYTTQNGADRALAFDHHGAPAIGYMGAGSFGDIRYARRLPGFGWASQDLFTGSSTVNRGEYASLAFDRYERPMLSYRRGGGSFDDGLRLSHFDGQAWQTQVIDEAGADPATWSNLAFDRLGRAGVVYKLEDPAFESLKFVHDLDGDFDLTDETPAFVLSTASPTEFPFYLSLAFDGLNRPIVVHTNNDGDLKVSIKETLSWFTTDIVTQGAARGASIAINPVTGFPAVSFGTTGSLQYAEWDGDAWNVDTIDNLNFIGSSTSLAFDPTDGRPAIAYTRYDAGLVNGELKIAWFDGATWQNDVVDGAGNVGYNPSIAFREFGDGDRVAAIAYYDRATGDLWYIEDPEPVPLPAAAWLLAGALALLPRPRRRRG